MKKGFYTIVALTVLILLLMFSVSCTNTNVQTTTNTNVQTTLSNSSGNGSPIVEDAVAVYYSFEGACRMATNVVLAEYQGSFELSDRHVVYRFKVSDRLLGSCDDEIEVVARRVRVSVSGANGMKLSYNNEEIPLTVGREYLLPLYTSPSAYRTKTYYQFIGGLAIDVEAPEESTMYGQKGIADHIKETSLDIMSKETLKSYVAEVTRDNKIPEAIPAPESLQELVTLSPEILVVKVGELESVTEGVYENTYVYYCTVKDVLKTDDASHEQIVSVRFSADSVKEGDTVIVFADNYSDYYFFTSKNTHIDSVQSVDKKDEIVSLIEALQ